MNPVLESCKAQWMCFARVWLCGLCALLFNLPLAWIANAAAADVPPNVVIILSDDQAWSDYSFLVHPQIKTPHLDKLAAQSVTFTRGYVPTSLCRPSLMSLISGQYPHQHLVTGNDPPKGTDRNEMLKHVDRKSTRLNSSHL